MTDEVLPKRLGPKRATKIRRFFNLDKSDDVRKFVIRREVVPKKEGAKPYTKAPKIQRLYVPRLFLSFCLSRVVVVVLPTDLYSDLSLPARALSVTPERLQRRRHLRSLARRKTEAQKAQKAEYEQIVAKRLAERKVAASAVKAKKA